MALKEILFSNNASTYLKESITSTDTELKVLDGTGVLFPEPDADEFFYITLQHPKNIYFEIVKCISRNGDVFKVERGQENTIPYAFPEGSYLELRLTKGGLDHLKRTIEEFQNYHEFHFDNEDEIVINHGLNKYPIVNIINESGELIYGDVTYLDRNTIKVEFSEPLTGIITLL